MICSCHTLPILLSKLSELLMLININSWQCVLHRAHALTHSNNINKVLLLLLLLVKVAQSCLTLWPHELYSPWNSPSQNTGLEWVAFPFRSSQPRDQTQVSLIYLQADSLPAEPWGKLKNTGVGSLSLLQQIFLTQELNHGLLHCRLILY